MVHFLSDISKGLPISSSLFLFISSLLPFAVLTISLVLMHSNSFLNYAMRRGIPEGRKGQCGRVQERTLERDSCTECSEAVIDHPEHLSRAFPSLITLPSLLELKRML